MTPTGRRVMARATFFGSRVRVWNPKGLIFWCGCAYARLTDGTLEAKFLCARHEAEDGQEGS